MLGSTLGGSLLIGVCCTYQWVFLDGVGEGGTELLKAVLTELLLGWKRYMEWMYPVDIVITNKAAFNAAGIVGAAAL